MRINKIAKMLTHDALRQEINNLIITIKHNTVVDSDFLNEPDNVKYRLEIFEEVEKELKEAGKSLKNAFDNAFAKK